MLAPHSGGSKRGERGGGIFFSCCLWRKDVGDRQVAVGDCTHRLEDIADVQRYSLGVHLSSHHGAREEEERRAAQRARLRLLAERPKETETTTKIHVWVLPQK